ncbi:RNA methyltransferase [Elizabethkingia argentiflava]|uniref:RNA methyltransferase n=1 Tax=Elizabethkingia argenteiflava TaxID=2681556 RepID=A0A845PTJ6_9FLAO|nr:RNA methyltransferase [Elizabethkingia argenteiflava]NAW51134.1 RNA methyltransferase [Elizabethkingia argenteiflava]
MLTHHTIKTLQSLDKKKFRQKYNLFLVEGNKIIRELIQSAFKIQAIYSLNPEEFNVYDIEIHAVTEVELKKISFLQHPKDSVAVCVPLSQSLDSKPKIRLVLDGIQDPGNMGTIIRLADWFGIEEIVCSQDTVDFYNPKVIQASMGSFSRVKIVYTDLSKFLSDKDIPNYMTDMDGDNLFSTDFPSVFNLVLGNEGNGIRPLTETFAYRKISIPRFGHQKNTESLNVAMATGIILGQIFASREN